MRLKWFYLLWVTHCEGQGQGLDPGLVNSRACPLTIRLSWGCCEVLSLGLWGSLSWTSPWVLSCPISH